jgi:hypothetical protein
MYVRSLNFGLLGNIRILGFFWGEKGFWELEIIWEINEGILEIGKIVGICGFGAKTRKNKKSMNFTKT